VLTATATSGLILLGDGYNPIAFNNTALQILAYPTKPDKINQPLLFVRDKVKFRLIKSNGGNNAKFILDLTSGRRKYNCRVFQFDLDCSKNGSVRAAILLERQSHVGGGLVGILEQQFNLTPREVETVALLFEGLTSKQIAERMKISPNTVKAFLRIVMVKMAVSTRSGIVGKIIGVVPEREFLKQSN
jgi:DNA-binding CsgD family transcriptional regulator